MELIEYIKTKQRDKKIAWFTRGSYKGIWRES